MMKAIWFMLIILSVVSCTTRKAGWEKSQVAKVMSAADFKATEQQAMELWKQRHVLESLQQSLNLLKDLHSAKPDDIEILTYLTRGHYLMADAHLENADEKKKIFEQAASYGEMGMALNAEFKASVAQDEDVEKALKYLTLREVPIIYWTAASLGKWAKMTGIAAALKYKTRIKAMISKVEELQPDYFFGAVPRYWGGFFAVAPSFAGGDINKSGDKFDTSIKMGPNYLGTRVLKAELYWTKKSNKKEFVKELETVLAMKEDIVAELMPENVLEKRKAKKLLAQKDELF
jgi:hypothetical protein